MNPRLLISLNHKITIQKYSGTITKQKILQLLSDQYKNIDYIETTKIISDFRETKVNFNEEDLYEITEFIKINSTNKNEIINVIITDDPMTTAYTMIFQDLMSDQKNFKCFVCSTIRRASEYLDLPEKIIDSLIESAFSKAVS